MAEQPKDEDYVDVVVEREAFERTVVRDIRRLDAGMELCLGYLRAMLRREMTLAIVEKLEREYEVKIREIERDE